MSMRASIEGLQVNHTGSKWNISVLLLFDNFREIECLALVTSFLERVFWCFCNFFLMFREDR
jgi:hypothetical protein